MTFGLESRALLLALLLCGLLGGVALHEYRAVGVADAHCDTKLAVQVGNQNTATQTDQARADAANIAALQQQIQQLQSDAEHAAAIKTQLQAQLHDQDEVLAHVRQTSKPTDCVNQRVPAELIDSLHAGTSGPADAPGGSHALRGQADRAGLTDSGEALRRADGRDVVRRVAGVYLPAQRDQARELQPRDDREAGGV
jgi:hypothetical protein